MRQLEISIIVQVPGIDDPSGDDATAVCTAVTGYTAEIAYRLRQDYPGTEVFVHDALTQEVKQ